MPEQTEFPIPFAEFAAKLVGTEHEVWTHLLKLEHGLKKFTVAEWQKCLSALKGK